MWVHNLLRKKKFHILLKQQVWMDKLDWKKGNYEDESKQVPRIIRKKLQD